MARGAGEVCRGRRSVVNLTRGLFNPMPHESFTLTLTPRQAQALKALAALEDLPPEVYAAEVLARHLYHAYTPEAARRAADPPAGS